MNISVDYDDTSVDMNTSLMKWHNDHYGTGYRYEDITSFDLSIVWQCSREEVYKRVNAFYQTEEFLTLPPVAGAQDVLFLLSQKYGLSVVTSRPEEIRTITMQSVDTHFPNYFSGIYCTVPSFGSKEKKPKSQVCKEIGAEVMIDDHLDNVVDCSKEGIRSFLLRRPWNQSMSDKKLQDLGIIPVAQWGDILPYLL